MIIYLGDGCIFVWRLPPEMTSAMLTRLSRGSHHGLSTLSPFLNNEVPSPSQTPEKVFLEPPLAGAGADYRFSIGKLPSWAKKQVENNGSNSDIALGQKGVDFPKGWNEIINFFLTCH